MPTVTTTFVHACLSKRPCVTKCKKSVVEQEHCHTFPDAVVDCRDKLESRKYILNKVVCDRERDAKICRTIPWCVCVIYMNGFDASQFWCSGPGACLVVTRSVRWCPGSAVWTPALLTLLVASVIRWDRKVYCKVAVPCHPQLLLVLFHLVLWFLLPHLVGTSIQKTWWDHSPRHQ